MSLQPNFFIFLVFFKFFHISTLRDLPGFVNFFSKLFVDLEIFRV